MAENQQEMRKCRRFFFHLIPY